MDPPDVKICGLTQRADVELAAASGARYGGVILAPGRSRSITADQAREMFLGLDLRRVGVFVDAGPEEIRRAADVIGLDVLQLHGSETAGMADSLRSEGREVWKAVHARTAEELARAVEVFVDSVDGLLLDGWAPEAPGGTGTRFDWEVLAAARAAIPGELRLIVAGGLRPENVGEAISILRPDVVDVSSGVETSPGIKDSLAVPAFIAAASVGPR